MGGVVIAMGVMSGTSADGVDAVMLELESLRRRHEPRASRLTPIAPFPGRCATIWFAPMS